jgi:hypothetical protein
MVLKAVIMFARIQSSLKPLYNRHPKATQIGKR